MKIICIGRNYSEHALELGNNVPAEPMFFLKPETALLPKRNPLYYPSFTANLQYELEVVFKICRLGKNIQKKFAHKYYNEIGLGIDFTARDLQQQCKLDGHPWEKAKAFDGSAVLGNKFIPKEQFNDINNLSFQLLQNGSAVQSGNTKDMIFTIDELIEHVSQFFTLKIGDLIFTGTPSGVGGVSIDDRLEGFLENEKLVSVNIK